MRPLDFMCAIIFGTSPRHDHRLSLRELVCWAVMILISMTIILNLLPLTNCRCFYRSRGLVEPMEGLIYPIPSNVSSGRERLFRGALNLATAMRLIFLAFREQVLGQRIGLLYAKKKFGCTKLLKEVGIWWSSGGGAEIAVGLIRWAQNLKVHQNRGAFLKPN